VSTRPLRKALPDFSRLTLLVVEDDRDSRGFLSELLRSCGAIVVEAESIRAAKAFVPTMSFALIVTDLALPGEDGAIFLRRLREQPADQGGAVPAIAVIAFYEQYPPGEVPGWAAYFRKPVDIDDLVRTIAGLCRARLTPADRPSPVVLAVTSHTPDTVCPVRSRPHPVASRGESAATEATDAAMGEGHFKRDPCGS
jgi:CheY-like chemotaxis protein